MNLLRRWAANSLLRANAKLATELDELRSERDALLLIVQVHEAQRDAMAEVIARDRARVQAEAAVYARQRAEAEGTNNGQPTYASLDRR